MSFTYNKVLGVDGKFHYATNDNDCCFCGAEISSTDISKYAGRRTIYICTQCDALADEFDED